MHIARARDLNFTYIYSFSNINYIFPKEMLLFFNILSRHYSISFIFSIWYFHIYSNIPQSGSRLSRSVLLDRELVRLNKFEAVPRRCRRRHCEFSVRYASFGDWLTSSWRGFLHELELHRLDRSRRNCFVRIVSRGIASKINDNGINFSGASRSLIKSRRAGLTAERGNHVGRI